MSNNRELQRHRIMSTLPSAAGSSGLKAASPSHSLPDLRPSIKPNAFGGMLPATGRGPTQMRPIGASKSVTLIQYPRRDQARTRFTVPNYGHSKEDTQKLPSHLDMIIGVLRAGDGHCQRGMKWSDIMEVAYYVYPNLPKSQATMDSLKRTLENVVAKGVVTRSFGARPSDATYRIVNSAGPLMSISEPGFGLNLAVSGTAIRPMTGSSHRTCHGICLPSGNNFQTRVARTPARSQASTSLKPKVVMARIPQMTKSTSAATQAGKPFASFSSVEKCKLSKSFAYRVGATEMLKPLECIPNSPVSGQNGNPDMNSDESNQSSPGTTAVNSRWGLGGSLGPVWETADRDEEDDNRALTDRFRTYAQAISLESEDDGGDDNEILQPQRGSHSQRVVGTRPRTPFGSDENFKAELPRKMSAPMGRFREIIEVN